jgi:hypothetical protein
MGTRSTKPRPKAKPSAETVTAADVPFPVWKAEALLALAKVHQRAVAATHDSFWTRLYVRGLDPEEAAQAAAREYDSTPRPDWARW